MKRLCLVFAIALLGCSLVDRTTRTTSTPEQGEGVGVATAARTVTRRATPTQKPSAEPPVEPTIDPADAETFTVAPFCTILGNAETEYVDYGYSIDLIWGWTAMTRQQVLDYIDSVIMKVTFDGREITDAEQGDVFAEDGNYHVFWGTTLGVLARGKYKMTFFEEFRTKIFDGWDYYGPGTENETVEDTCYLVIQ